MTRHILTNALSAAPTDAPKRGGDEVALPDGSVIKAVRDPDGLLTGLLAWRWLSLSPLRNTVRAVVPDNLSAAVTASDGGMTLTANANGSFNAAVVGGPGGVGTWAVSDGVTNRLILSGMATTSQNGVWQVAALGDGSNPYRLVRVDDARAYQSLPRGRPFFVTEGNAAGQVWIHATAGSGALVIGTSALTFTRIDQDAYDAAVNVTPASLQPVAAGAISLSPMFSVSLDIAAGAAGVRDVSIFTADAPVAFEVVGIEVVVSAAGVGGTTGQLRTAAGGGGSAYSGPVPLDAVGVQRDAAGGGVVATRNVAVNGTLVFRMADGALACRLHVHCRRV